MATKNLVLRTVYIDPDVDDALRNEAFEGKTSKNDLIRKYLKLGMQQSAANAAPLLVKGAPRTAASSVAAKSTKAKIPVGTPFKGVAAKKASASTPARAPAAKKTAGAKSAKTVTTGLSHPAT